MSQVIAESTKVVWTVAQGVAEVVAKRTVVLHTPILGVTRGTLVAVRTFVLWTVDTKMPAIWQ